MSDIDAGAGHRDDRLDDQRIAVVGMLLEAASALERVLGEDLRQRVGMPLGALEILIRIGRSPGGRLPHHRLGRQLMWATGGVGHAVDRLEKVGLVCRERDAHDRRTSCVALTEPGRAALHAALPVHLAAVQRLVIDRLEPGSAARLEAAIRPLRDGLADDTGPSWASEQPRRSD